MMMRLRFLLAALGYFGFLVPMAAAEIVSVTVDADTSSETSDTLYQDPEADLDALRMREDYTLNKPRPAEDRVESVIDTAYLDTAAYTDPNVDPLSKEALIWEMSLPLSDHLSMEARAGYWPEAHRRDVVGLDTEGPRFDVRHYGLGAKLNVSDKIYLRSDYTRTDTTFQQSGAFTIGGGVNLVQVAKLVNDLAD